jgi:hypothetical protein
MEEIMGPQMYWGGWTKEGGGVKARGGGGRRGGGAPRGGGGGPKTRPTPPHFPEYSQTASVPPILLPRQEMIKGGSRHFPPPHFLEHPQTVTRTEICVQRKDGGGARARKFTKITYKLVQKVWGGGGRELFPRRL